MRALIWLKISTCNGGLKTYTSINFGVNLVNIEEVVSNFTHKTKANFCHTYRVNHFEAKQNPTLIQSQQGKKCRKNS